ncbi:DUF4435 domain-containing protein [Novosphingobium lindaniclasticum]
MGYARLFSAYNDIDVFVEDSTYVGVYERIINSVLAGKAKVTRVTPLGPRSEVERHAENDTGTHRRPRLYIVDGDLDLMAFSRQKKINRLHRLQVYSLENLLFEQHALEEYCRFASPGLANGACLSAVDVNGLVRELNETLLPYLVALAVARRLGLRGSVFALNAPSVARQINNRNIGPCRTKVRQRTREIISAIVSSCGRQKYKRERNLVWKNISRKSISGACAAPGKVFGLAYFNQRIGAAGGMELNQRAIASYLAQHCRLQNDQALASALRKAIRQP